MLVVTRRQNEKIVFPHLGITVEILRISGNAVRVGVDAPRNVAVLREELAPEAVAETERARRDFRHKLRNRLNAANLCLYLVQKQMQQHKRQDAERTLEKALTAFAALDLEIAEATQQPGLKLPKPTLRALLVEDDANESELLAGLLRISGFEVATASDGGQALDYLSAHRRPDVVLPGHGYAALRRPLDALGDPQQPAVRGTEGGCRQRPAPPVKWAFPSVPAALTSGSSSPSTRRSSSAGSTSAWTAMLVSPLPPGDEARNHEIRRRRANRP